MKKIFIITLGIILGFGFINTAKALNTPTVPVLCLDSGAFKWPFYDSNNKLVCAAGQTTIPANRPIATAKNIACIVIPKLVDGSAAGEERLEPSNLFVSVSEACDQYRVGWDEVRIITIFGTVPVYKDPTAGTNTTNQTQTVDTPVVRDINVPTNNTKNQKPGTKPGTSNNANPAGSSASTTAGNQGDCPEGFVQKGPLCVPNNPFGNGGGIAGNGTISGLATTIINILLGLAGIVAVFMIIIGGYQWMTARGNETQVTNGRKTLINALIGLVIVVLSFAVVQVVVSFLTKGTS